MGDRPLHWYWPYSGLPVSRVEQEIEALELERDDAVAKLDEFKVLVQSVEDGIARTEDRIAKMKQDVEWAMQAQPDGDDEDDEPLDGEPIRVMKHPGMPDQHYVLRYPDGHEEPEYP